MVNKSFYYTAFVIILIVMILYVEIFERIDYKDNEFNKRSSLILEDDLIIEKFNNKIEKIQIKIDKRVKDDKYIENKTFILEKCKNVTEEVIHDSTIQKSIYLKN
jgi:hypothetical protein